MLAFVEGGKPEYPEKNLWRRDEYQQQTQPTYDAESGNRTQATLVRGECSHQCAVHAPSYEGPVGPLQRFYRRCLLINTEIFLVGKAALN